MGTVFPSNASVTLSLTRRESALALKDVCERHRTPLKAAAIQFPLAHPAVTTVLSGAGSRAEFDENRRMFDFDIPAPLWDELRMEGSIRSDAPTPIGAGTLSPSA
jgi:D-threo-aldose 1-dehydrogenase